MLKTSIVSISNKVHCEYLYCVETISPKTTKSCFVTQVSFLFTKVLTSKECCSCGTVSFTILCYESFLKNLYDLSLNALNLQHCTCHILFSEVFREKKIQKSILPLSRGKGEKFWNMCRMCYCQLLKSRIGIKIWEILPIQAKKWW